MIDSIWNVRKVKLYATTCIKTLVICSRLIIIKIDIQGLASFMLVIKFVYCEQQKNWVHSLF